MSVDFKNCTIIPKRCRERFLRSLESDNSHLYNLGIQGAGISNLVSPYTICRLNPNFFLVIFTVNGSGTFSTKKETWIADKGHTTILPPNSPQHYYANKNWDIVWFHLDPNHPNWKQLLDQSLSHGPTANIDILQKTMEIYLQEKQLQRSDSDCILDPIAKTISALLTRELYNEELPNIHQARIELNKAWSKVQADLSFDWDIDKLATSANLSVPQLNRKCKLVHGTSPMNYVRKLRIEYASQLILSTPYSLSEIAEITGYETPFALSKAFKNQKGISPKDYRNKWLQT